MNIASSYIRHPHISMHYVASLLLILFFINRSYAQNFAGIRTSNKVGFVKQLVNPAFKADMPDKWSVHIFSFQGNLAGSNASLNWSSLPRLTTETLKEKWVSSSKNTFVFASAEMLGPAVMWRTPKIGVLSFSTRSRLYVNGYNLDGRIIADIDDHGVEMVSHPYTVGPKLFMRANNTMLNELVLGWADKIWEKGAHQLRGGVNVKYISGVSNASLAIEEFNGTVRYNKQLPDSYLTDASGVLSTRTAGKSLNHIGLFDLFKMRKGGLGADIGFSYEFHSREEKKTYLLKFALALNDIGAVAFQPDSKYSINYDVSIPANKQFYFHEGLSGSEFNKAASVFDKYPAYFKETAVATTSYRIGLPTTLNWSVDYNLDKGFFVNFEAQENLRKIGSPAAIYTYSFYALTPRYENDRVGVFLPLSYNPLSKMQAGLALRFGPVFIGSGSLFTALGKSKQLDGFFGVSFSKKATKP
ncbi:DUF5723 family protein [Adhaeribacter aquaticus]|uniref:DUF5723 family protein n=1 Tax=Adhaeribacter aquaticus TaxID=299567 RepID=UPI0003FB15C9|nr:DUF5723 family protein [Adhaeribacter aquaticus]